MSTDKIIYFVRHGQSEGNIAPVFQPTDSPLSEEGRRQAQKIADRVARLTFDSLIVSPLPRTRQTAEYITASTGKNPEFSEIFVECRRPASVDGKSYDDKDAQALWHTWSESRYVPGLRVDDGENFDDLIARADKALDFLNKRKEKTIVVVTHGYFLRVLMARVVLGNLLTGDVFRQFLNATVTQNTGITVIKYCMHGEGLNLGPDWMLSIFNDHAHLG